MQDMEIYFFIALLNMLLSTILIWQ